MTYLKKYYARKILWFFFSTLIFATILFMLSCAQQKTTLTSVKNELTEEIALIVRGRVVDGPISGATVFIDLNNNGVKDSGEPTEITDESGFYSIPKDIDIPFGSIIIATGGTDTITGENMGSHILMSSIPERETDHIQISPITTVLVSLDTDEEKQNALTALGIIGKTVDDIISTDFYKESQEGQGNRKNIAINIEKKNLELANILRASQTIAKEKDTENVITSTEIVIKISKEISKKIESTSASQPLDLASSANVRELLSSTMTELSSENKDLTIDSSKLDAISKRLSEANQTISELDIVNMESEETKAKLRQANSFHDLVKNVVGGTKSTHDFLEETSGVVSQKTQYFFVQERQTYLNAKSHAESKGGHLVIINSEQENQFILSMAIPGLGTAGIAPDGGYSTYIWLGGSDIDYENNWKWVDGSTISTHISPSVGYSNWGSGTNVGGTGINVNEPDNFAADPNTEQDALGMALENWPNGVIPGIGTPGQWNDISASNELTYIIECPGSKFWNNDLQQCKCDNGSNCDNESTANNNCPNDPLKTEPGICGCGVADTDSDGDSIPDCNDNCPSISNSNQANSDGDSLGNACDNDSYPYMPNDNNIETLSFTGGPSNATCTVANSSGDGQTCICDSGTNGYLSYDNTQNMWTGSCSQPTQVSLNSQNCKQGFFFDSTETSQHYTCEPFIFVEFPTKELHPGDTFDVVFKGNLWAGQNLAIDSLWIFLGYTDILTYFENITTTYSLNGVNWLLSTDDPDPTTLRLQGVVSDIIVGAGNDKHFYTLQLKVKNDILDNHPTGRDIYFRVLLKQLVSSASVNYGTNLPVRVQSYWNQDDPNASMNDMYNNSGIVRMRIEP